MAQITLDGTIIQIATDRLTAEVHTAGYVSGVAGGTLVDRATGATDLGHGLAIADFLLEPGSDHADTPEEYRYHTGDAFHGDLTKRYVELPQICTKASPLPYEIYQGEGYVAVKQWFSYTDARPPYRHGSTWEQWLVFPDGVRWFLAYDRLTSANDVEHLIFRQDIPGHLKHRGGDTFRQVYLSYHGVIDRSEFVADFAPHERFLYQRDDNASAEAVVRAYQTAAGPWLAGMALDPGMVYQGWCHQRGYICFIQEIGGRRVPHGGNFGAVHLIGFFDSPDEMHAELETYRGAGSLRVDERSWELEP